MDLKLNVFNLIQQVLEKILYWFEISFDFIYLSTTGSFYWFANSAPFEQKNVFADNKNITRTTKSVFKGL